TRRFAPTTPEYVGFCRGRPACLPLTKVALRWNLGFLKQHEKYISKTPLSQHPTVSLPVNQQLLVVLACRSADVKPYVK
ncbi:MAG: hypothetical protein DRQ99_15605, partial [Candidatus Parabeggiatoa sp. nov. 3]